MFYKTKTTVVFAAIAFATPVLAADLDTIKCTERASVQSVQDAILSAQSVQADADKSAIERKIDELIAAGACEEIRISPADEVVKSATTLHPEGGTKFGVVEYEGGYILAFDFTSDLF